MSLIHVFKVLYLSKLILSLLSKTSIFYLLCVLNHFHTHYASNVFQYLVFIFEQVLEKKWFSCRSWFLENIDLHLCLNGFTSKIVHLFVICVDFDHTYLNFKVFQ